MFIVEDFKASVQFDLNDPELAQKLLDLSSKLVIRGDASRVSYGSAGKALIIALMKRPDLIAELLGIEPRHEEKQAPKVPARRSGRESKAA